MYHVSAQGVDECMINVHYYYYYYEQSWSNQHIWGAEELKFKMNKYFFCWDINGEKQKQTKHTQQQQANEAYRWRYLHIFCF